MAKNQVIFAQLSTKGKTRNLVQSSQVKRQEKKLVRVET